MCEESRHLPWVFGVKAVHMANARSERAPNNVVTTARGAREPDQQIFATFFFSSWMALIAISYLGDAQVMVTLD